MKVRVPMMVQDPRFAAHGTETIVEGFDIEEEPYFLNGPVSERVAVLDFDSVTGKLVQGARFCSTSARKGAGEV